MAMTKSLLTLLIFSLTILFSFGQESPTTELPPKADAKPEALGPGDHARTVLMSEQKRTYFLHIPQDYDPMKPTPVVLALHGAAMNGSMMAWFSGLNTKSDEAGFIVVYPNGTGRDPILTWNAGSFGNQQVDDVAFIGQLLDDLGSVVNVDTKRVYACGMSNGGMMCYRLAAELSDRIAAIAPVAGTMAIEESKPKRPIPVIHFHGSMDKIVPFDPPTGTTTSFLKLKGVEESVQTWVKLNSCEVTPQTETISQEGDEMKVTRMTYGGGKDGSEVVLILIDEGGHTWPGQKPPVRFLGKSAMNISANDLIWEFFRQHPMK